MPVVDTSIFINASVASVYQIAKDSESYPQYMKDVISVTPVEREDNRLVADWVGFIPQFRLKIRWREEDLWDDATHSSKFRQLSGDYDRLEGNWQFTQEGEGTRFVQHLDYDYNVPTLGPLVKKLIYSIVVKNLNNINQAFKERAEALP